MGCSRQVLVQVVLFQFFGPGLTQDAATSNFSLYSKSALLGLSTEGLFVFGFFRKSVYKSQNLSCDNFYYVNLNSVIYVEKLANAVPKLKINI